MPTVRPPAVAGLFYPAEPDQLEYDIRQLLLKARAYDLRAKALIAPHAGYIYSGEIAATAYAVLKPVAARIHRVVLLGPTHRFAVNGLVLPEVAAFDTPLGRIMLDTNAAAALAHLPQVSISRQAHELEHSLEVQLPFLQSVLGEFILLPLAVGMATPKDVAEVLDAVWGGDETLIVVSSDLSHYLPYAVAQRADAATAKLILKLHPDIEHEQACGATPIGGLMIAAQHHRLSPHLLDLRNSGDTAGSKDQVVGYAAFAFTPDETTNNESDHDS